MLYAGHKELGLDHADAFKRGLDAEACTALNVFHLDTIWEEATTIYHKHASNSKGASGKKEWKQLAAVICGYVPLSCMHPMAAWLALRCLWSTLPLACLPDWLTG